ncbi:hypothetical protein ACNQFZ_19610 [Schinkia sp. CFF1]
MGKVDFIFTYAAIILPASLPGWAVYLYYLFFIATILAAIVAIFQKKVTIQFNGVTILLPFIMYIVSLFYGIGRPFEYDEFQWLLVELGHFRVWAVFVIGGYLYLLFWWYKFVKKR